MGKSGFTLAEVLITLGIIGVIAAMTLPVLVNKNSDKVLDVQYKKSQSIISNGYKLMMAKDEVFNVENLPIMACSNISCLSKEHKKYFKLAKDSANNLTATELPQEYAIDGKNVTSQFDWSKADYIFATVDGFVFGLFKTADKKSFDIIVDVNGSKNPNIVKHDLYKYHISNNGFLSDVSDDLAFIKSCSKEYNELCTTAAICENAGGRWCGFDKKSCIWDPNLACWQ